MHRNLPSETNGSRYELAMLLTSLALCFTNPRNGQAFLKKACGKDFKPLGDKGFKYHVKAEMDLFTVRLKEHAGKVLRKAGELNLGRSLYNFHTHQRNNVV